MTTSSYVALLRGINVGRAKRLAMADLRALVEKLGYGQVRTLLNSGNVVFSGPVQAPAKVAARIERALANELALSSRVTVLTAAELAEIVHENPLLGIADNPSLLLVAVLNDATDRKRIEPLTKEDWAPDAFAVGKRVAYLWCASGSLKSRLWPSVERLLGPAVTSRNWATITKLHALVEGKR